MEDLFRLVIVVAVLVAVAAAAAFVAQRFVGRVTVHEYERGMRFTGGRFIGLLDTGAYTWLRPTSEIVVVDSRPTSFAVDGQEVMTADGVAIKVSLVVRSAIGDPVARLDADQDPDRLLYLLVQLALRDVVAGRDLADILAARSALGGEILELVATRMGAIGVELLSVDVRDVMLPAELRRAFGAVVAAKHEGAASLERARAETATLRSLANAGRVLDDSPALLSLRLVQELTDHAGNTVVLGVPAAAGGLGARFAGAGGDGAGVPSTGVPSDPGAAGSTGGPTSSGGRRATDRPARRSGSSSDRAQPG